MAVLIDSASLGADLAERMERDLAPDRSWRVMIRPGSRQLVWQGEHDGHATMCRREPDTSWWLRAWVRIARRFPYIERLL